MTGGRYVYGVLVVLDGYWWLHAEIWVAAVIHRPCARCQYSGRHPVTHCKLYTRAWARPDR